MDSSRIIPECSRSVWQDDWRDGLAGASESRAWSMKHEIDDAWGIMEVEDWEVRWKVQRITYQLKGKRSNRLQITLRRYML